tara:strand:+ start:400 stop:642 length:243 start_codon:yes stop_codon:yes gene_type:complete
MTESKPYDDSNWKQEYLGYKHVNKKQRDLLENGAKSLSQSWLLGAMYSEWKTMKGYNKYDPKENVGQMQSSMKDFFKDHG